MALQTSGTINMNQIQAEFGGSNPINLSEYYRGGGLTTPNNTSVPTSGTINLSDFYGTQRLTGAMIIAALEPVAGSHAARGIDNYSGSTSSWSPTQTFTNSPIQGYSGSVFRAGNTNDTTFTVGSAAINYDLQDTTAISWTQSLSDTIQDDAKINGVAATSVAAAEYDVSAQSNNGKVYRSKYRVFKRPVQLTAGSTSVSSDFYSGGNYTQVNNKGGFLVLPGEWEVAQTSSTGLSGTGAFTVPANQIAMIICNGNADNDLNLLNLGTNSNLAFLLNYKANWYDNSHVVFIGNKTESNWSLSYNISSDAINDPKVVYFRWLGDG